MKLGFIKTYRSIQECWIWNCEKYDKAHAWIDLLLDANHQEVKMLIDSKPIIVGRGCLFTSKLNLANKWRWDRKTVTSFLSILESDGMITQKRYQHGTMITIVNYSRYQQSTDIGTDIGTDINKNVKKDKNVEECKEKKKTYTKDFEDAWEAYKRKGNKAEAYKRWLQLTDQEKEQAAKHIPHYARSREWQYMKDFQSYLFKKTFAEIIKTAKGETLFDPEQTIDRNYNPDTSFGSDVRQTMDGRFVMVVDKTPNDNVKDGYTTDNRPDGARLKFKYGQGVFLWNAETKQWVKEDKP